MGSMRFIVSPADRIPETIAEQAYLIAPDRIPWHVRTHWQEGELILERGISESACLQIPWRVEGHGLAVLSTATLCERMQPYYLPLELVRGKIAQVRNQLSEWQAIGMEIPATVEAGLAAVVRFFGQAVVGEPGSPESTRLADEALRRALDTAALLALSYTEQALAFRRRQSPKLPTLLGADLGSSVPDDHLGGQLLQAFNLGNVPMTWREVEATEGGYCWDVCDRQVEWCRAHGLAVSAGPLLQLNDRSIPDWLHLCDGDFESIHSFACQFVEAVVSRYRGRVDLWLSAGRINTAELLSLREEERVRLAARAVELTRSLDPEAQILVSFDQPWAEYLSRREHDFPPLHFADALLRADLGLTGLALEINLGYSPGGTLPRDLLDFSQQVDYWSYLGVPLVVAVTVPSGSHADPLAQRQTMPPLEDWTPATQQAWVNRYVPLLLAKPSVQGILWSQLRDSEPHGFPHGGLFDLRRHPKPALRQLASIRQAHLR